MTTLDDPQLRVVHVYKDVYPPVAGGIEKYIDAVRTAMPDVASHVLVCARRSRTSIRRAGTGVEILVAELGRALSVPLAPTFPLWLRRIDADVVHVHMPNPMGEIAALLALRNRPLVVSFHADIVRQAALMPLYRPLVEACLDRAAAIVVGSYRLLESSPLLEDRYTSASVIPYGVDLSKYDPAAVPTAARDRLRSRYGVPLVLAVGRLVYYKGYEQLIAAARTLNAAVVIVGSGPLEARLRAHAADVPNVHFTGSVSEKDLLVWLAAADCFVLPSTSRAESFGVATIEAQAMGLPAVVTDVGTGTIDAITPGKTGLVVPPGDAGALEHGIRSIVGHPRRQEAMGVAARARALRQHSLESHADRLRQIYREVTA